jgi:hypothetical protein
MSDNLQFSSQPQLPFEAFKGFQERYTRATEIFRDFFKLSDHVVFSRVREDSRAWQKYKFVCKVIKCATESPEFPLSAFRMRQDASGRAHYRNTGKSVCKMAVKLWEAMDIWYCPPYTNVKLLWESFAQK